MDISRVLRLRKLHGTWQLLRIGLMALLILRVVNHHKYNYKPSSEFKLSPINGQVSVDCTGLALRAQLLLCFVVV